MSLNWFAHFYDWTLWESIVYCVLSCHNTLLFYEECGVWNCREREAEEQAERERLRTQWLQEQSRVKSIANCFFVPIQFKREHVQPRMNLCAMLLHQLFAPGPSEVF